MMINRRMVMRECRTFSDLAGAFDGRPETTLAFAFLHFGYGMISYSPVYMHKGWVPNGPLEGEDAVMLDPLPVSHYTHSAPKTDAKHTARLLTPAMMARYSGSYDDLPVVVKSSESGYYTAKSYLPLGMIESLTFAGDPIGIALSPGSVDESLCHLGDDILTGYIRSDERINGVTYPSVKSWSLWEYAKQHMEHGDNDDAGVDDLVEAPLLAFR